jgi:microsomal dipeptidase-like Zn-dependent dipeptidase
MIRTILFTLGLLSLIGVSVVFGLGPGLFEQSMNRLTVDDQPTVDSAALTLHKTLVIGDLHADTALWQRPIESRSNRGHVDLERLLEGNITLQMFTTVTKSPRGQNYEENSSEAFDNISLLALIQRWPAATRESLAERALYQADRINQAAADSPHLQVVLNQGDLEDVLARRGAGEPIVGALIGTEGSHALDVNIENVDRLYAAGFRMMSLQHFFDNALGGSLHGESNQGLTSFGEQAVDRMIALGIMIDVAHSSEAVVQDLLARHPVPLIVSHTGFQGHCASPRNISDDTMELITNAGGLIGVGFWDGATCGSDVDSIVGAIRYGIDRFGLEHIALGSDWDGAISAPFDAANIAQLTQGLLDAEFSEAEIRAVMGGNMVRFLKTHLPAGR